MFSTSGQSIVDEPGGYYMYAASKHAVRVLTEGLRRELRDLGTKIRVTVCKGIKEFFG
jgi:NAD(P)-dependent dehydrogenase (short-subunit alcohol dehydrogenase family)